MGGRRQPLRFFLLISCFKTRNTGICISPIETWFHLIGWYKRKEKSRRSGLLFPPSPGVPLARLVHLQVLLNGNDVEIGGNGDPKHFLDELFIDSPLF